MRSKLHIKGHPVHPMLVGFPIAFFIGTLIFDALGYYQNNREYWETGMKLELLGIVFSLLAAIPGIIDFFGIIPPRSSAKKRGVKHGLLNIGILIIFTAVWYYRQETNPSQDTVIVLEFTGVMILLISSWLGGTLVFRNQIGVDHRFASAGKWREVYVKQGIPGKEVEVAIISELKINQMKLIHVNGKRLVLSNTEEGFIVFNDFCTHKGGSLADGVLIGHIVQCPWHGSQFDIRSGDVLCGPAHKKIKTYSVRAFEGKVLLRLPESRE